jgi:transposase
MIVAEGVSKTEAARRLGVDRSTVFNWFRKNETFAEEYEKELRAVTVSRRREYALAAEKAADKLGELLECGSPNTQLAAVKLILELAGDTEKEIVSNSESVSAAILREALENNAD